MPLNAAFWFTNKNKIAKGNNQDAPTKICRAENDSGVP